MGCIIRETAAQGGRKRRDDGRCRISKVRQMTRPVSCAMNEKPLFGGWDAIYGTGKCTEEPRKV